MKVEVKISPEARARYLQRRLQDMIDCRAAIDSKDFNLIERVGHTIKGNAETFGFNDLTLPAKNLEEAGEASDVSKILTLIEEIETYLKNQT